MSIPRKASAVPDGDFPYLDPRVCWVLVTDKGEVLNPQGTPARLSAAALAQQGKGRLFMAWPGRTRTDLFEADSQEAIDKIVAMLKEVGW